jgi:hypothetical protein
MRKRIYSDLLIKPKAQVIRALNAESYSYVDFRIVERPQISSKESVMARDSELVV